MQDSTILPLLEPSATNQLHRRNKSLQWSLILRFIARRRLKFYLALIVVLTISLFTILRRLSTSDNNQLHQKHNNNNNELRRQKLHFETRTMKTVIGRYVGPKLDWNEGHNLSDEILNTNNYDPDPEIGRDGRPAYLPGYPQDQMKLLYSINRFNLVASDKISVDRKLPEARKLACRKINYNLKDLPHTTVIIVFHNEAWSTLARTVHSIVNTAPAHLIAEILLVDDASNRTFLGKTLEYYMNSLSSRGGVPIKVIRSKQRVGLIGARLIGVEQARGEVLTFIDAHCEATRGWLEPLLQEVKLNSNTAACPIIDIINEDTFAFTRSFELHLGAFNWGLNFRWYPISRRELVASNGYSEQQGKVRLNELVHPFHTPVMAGGLFSINRDYFNRMGKYDPEMDIWGGENIELSLRLWQCGGQVKIVPCSHVAHIFRKSSPYTFRPGKEVGDILYSNLARVAEVWMDDWRKFFYSVNPVVNRTLHKVGREAAFKNIDTRKQLRRDLNCKGFEWFLDHVWPEHFFPKEGRFFGRIRQLESGKCLQKPVLKIGMGQAAVGAVETSQCQSNLTVHQLFVFNQSSGFLMTDENICLDSGSDPMPSRQAILAPCSDSIRQKWNFTENSYIIHRNSGLCLDSASSGKVSLEKCDLSRTSLKWELLDKKYL